MFKTIFRSVDFYHLTHLQDLVWLPEKSQNSFVDLQSQKEIEKETHQRRNFFLLNAEMLQFD